MLRLGFGLIKVKVRGRLGVEVGVGVGVGVANAKTPLAFNLFGNRSTRLKASFPFTLKAIWVCLVTPD
jgi:hypothetical protein